MSHLEKIFSYSGTIHWFPGHMARATKDIKEKLLHAESVLEIRDARIPLSSTNPTLEELTKNKNKLIIFNKRDLADPSKEGTVTNLIRKQGHKCMFLTGNDFNQKNKIKQIVPTLLHSLRSPATLTATSILKEERQRNILVLGMPNVGKSTIINAIKIVTLKGKKVAKTGPLPGVTKDIQGFKISDDPIAYLLDTPGVMLPKIDSDNNELGLKLALAGAIKDAEVGVEIMSDYLLYVLNKYKVHQYVNLFQLSQPTDDINLVFHAIAKKYGAPKSKDGSINTDFVGKVFLEKYRKSELGRLTLDDFDISLPHSSSSMSHNSSEKTEIPKSAVKQKN